MVPLEFEATVKRFTHVDPFEDTESCARHDIEGFSRAGFTHVDPFEDTESK